MPDEPCRAPSDRRAGAHAHLMLRTTSAPDRLLGGRREEALDRRRERRDLPADEQVEVGPAVADGRPERVQERAVGGDRQLGQDVGRPELDAHPLDRRLARAARPGGRRDPRRGCRGRGGARRAARARPASGPRRSSRSGRGCRARGAAGSRRSPWRSCPGRAARRCGSGASESSEIWSAASSPASGSRRASSLSVKSVAFVSVTVGRIRDSSTSVSANHGSMKTSPPVIPTHVKPSSSASRTARSIASRGERPPVRDARRRLGQAVDAREVAVVGRVEPEAVADPALPTAVSSASLISAGGGMSKAVQYWFSIVIVPARTVSSISWSSRSESSVRATSSSVTPRASRVTWSTQATIARSRAGKRVERAPRRRPPRAALRGTPAPERDRAVRGKAVAAAVQLRDADDHELLRREIDASSPP